jgi:lipid-binding SYLF domain-containing protein
MNFRPFVVIPVVAAIMVVPATSTLASKLSGVIDTLESATQVIEVMMSNPKTRIPPSVLKNSQGIAVIPKVVKAGFFVGGSHGKGVLVMRDANGGWSNPVFLKLTSGSVGLQFGAQSSDVVLVFRNKTSINTVLRNNFTLGGSVSVSAGPVGGDIVSPNDEQVKTSIYSYALNQGLFAGVSLEGAKVAFDQDRNEDFYDQRNLTVRQILNSPPLQEPPQIPEFKEALNQAIASGQS